jgi:malonyl-CoA/methylmalonyl-CoA synthetase
MLAWRWSKHDHLVHSLPISHQHGLSGIHATLLAGSRATILSDFDPGELLTTASLSGATVLFGVPAIHQRLIDHVGQKGRLPASVRLVTSGSAPLPAEIARTFEETFGHQIVERYGTTESGLNVSNPYVGAREPGHVGVPLPGVEIAIVGEYGQRMTPGEHGEVVVRGPQVFNGYRDEEPDGFIDGWFRTGDLGVVDPRSGYLRLVGRTREVIITGGMNVYPREVEDAIREAGEVTDVAVIGVPSSRWGEEVVAFVSSSTRSA